MPTNILKLSFLPSDRFVQKGALPLFFAVIAVIQLLCLPGRYLGREHDDVLYVLASRSMLSGGYSLGVSPGEPPLTEITPGWPILMLPAALLSGNDALGYQLWAWLWLLACNILVWLWLRRRMDPGSAAAGTALFALNPLVLSRSGIVMTEIPFLAFALALLLLLESPRGLAAWRSGLALGFAWLIRPGALPLFPAVWGWYVFKGRRKDALISAVYALGTVGLWQLWVVFSGQELAEVRELSMTLPAGGAQGVLATGLFNISHALTLWGRMLLPWSSSESVIGLFVGAFCAVLSAAGMRSAWKKCHYEAAIVYAACGMFLHIVWPWWYERYLIVFLPFLIWGLVEVLGYWKNVNRAAILTLLILIPLPIQGRALMKQSAGNMRPELQRTYQWIRRNTPEEALWTSAFFARDAFYTGRPFLPLYAAETLAPGELRRRLRAAGVSYFLWQDPPNLGSSLGEGFFGLRRIRAYEAALRGAGGRALFSNATEGAAIFEVQ